MIFCTGKKWFLIFNLIFFFSFSVLATNNQDNFQNQNQDSDQVEIYIPPVGSSDHPSEAQPEVELKNSSVLNQILDTSRVPDSLRIELGEDGYQRFLKGRRRTLTLLYRLLRVVTYRNHRLFEKMHRLDLFVQDSAIAIAHSNRTGLVISISGSMGIGISAILMRKIRRHKLFKLLPRSGGFFLLLGAGLGVYRVRSENGGRDRLIVEGFVDFDRLKKIQTFASEVSVAANWGLVMDHSEKKKLDQLESQYIGILGVVRQGQDHFSYSFVTGAAFPPLLPVGMVYENITKRYHIPFFSIPLLKLKSNRLDLDFDKEAHSSSAGEIENSLVDLNPRSSRWFAKNRHLRFQARHQCQALFQRTANH